MKNRFYDVFPNLPALLPVIHVSDMGQARISAETARESGVDGVFLIDHYHYDRSPDYLEETYRIVRKSSPDLWVGLNFLGSEPTEAVKRCNDLGADGAWIDNYPDCDILRSSLEVQIVEERGHEGGYDGLLLFAGVAFKTQRAVELDDLPSLALEAGRKLSGYGVVTTSGPATGRPPELEKILAMKRSIDQLNGVCPLAIASGMSVENIAAFVPYVDAFLVGTDLEDIDTYLLNANRIKLMQEAIQSAR